MLVEITEKKNPLCLINVLLHLICFMVTIRILRKYLQKFVEHSMYVGLHVMFVLYNSGVQRPCICINKFSSCTEDTALWIRTINKCFNSEIFACVPYLCTSVSKTPNHIRQKRNGSKFRLLTLHHTVLAFLFSSFHHYHIFSQNREMRGNQLLFSFV